MSAALAELEADAALRGETIAQAAIRKARAALDALPKSRGSVSGGMWRSISPELRQVLITMGTGRLDAEAAASLQWGQFSDGERVAIGSMAREWRRQLEGAGWLR